ncbi:MAG: leucyl aminopeptidase [Bacilli bacterium]|jgi:leucyl aminopeptidase|nr:leucyl aminopeptidase [Bacilli bacterium]
MEIIKNCQPFNSNHHLVVGFFEKETIKLHPAINEELEKLQEQELIKQEKGAVTKIFTFGRIANPVVCFVALGQKESYQLSFVTEIAAKISKECGDHLIVLVPTFVGLLDEEEVFKKMVMDIDFYQYQYDECKSKKQERQLEVGFVRATDQFNGLEEYLHVATAISNTRDLVNKPYNYLDAKGLADYAVRLVDDINHPRLKVKILEKKAIEALEMNAFLGVNQGSTAEPQLIHLSFQNSEKPEKVGLVGKGVMFDTGGYSLKQTMNNMKDDMGGAATVIGIMEALARNDVKVNVEAIICATDNRIDGKALLPDDVLTAMNKKTIEIVSTDAEGRLTLADALCYAQKEGCKKVIDLATLTGAVVVALGDYTTGIFGNNDEMIEKIIASGKKTNEDIWHLPITDHIRKQVRSSKVADLTNSTGRNMGASGAAAFLEEFVEEGTKWVHLDIAGTIFHTSPSYQEAYGASGVMVKTLYEYLKNN